MKALGLAVFLAVVLGTIGCGNSNHFVYAVGPGTNSVIGFTELSTGQISPLSNAFSTDSGPVAFLIHPSGIFAFAVNSNGANITAFDRAGNGVLKTALDPTTGLAIGPFTLANNPTAMAMTPNGQFLYALQTAAAVPGSTNVQGSISAFVINNTSAALSGLNGAQCPTVFVLCGTIFPLQAGATSTPTAITITADGLFLYAVDSAQAVIDAFAINPGTGVLTAVPGSPFSVGVAPAFVISDPQAKFLYAADPGTNQIFGFNIGAGTGALTPITGFPVTAGNQPVALGMDSTGVLLLAANQASNNVSAYSMNPATGAVTQMSGSPFATGVTPVFVTVDSTNRFVYVADKGSNDIVAFSLSGGTLKAVPLSPFNVTVSPTWLTSR